MKSGLTELVIIIDKSGSMSGLEKDVVGGFNSLIESQKKEGETIVTTILFDSTYRVIHDRVNINDIKNLGEKDYIPSGCTALLDSVGNAISHLKQTYSNMKEEAIPEHTIFSIMTDGYENSSKEYGYKQIKEMIQAQKNDGWDFLFQAANIDEKFEADRLGIDDKCAYRYEASEKGIKDCYTVMTQGICKARAKSKRNKNKI